MRAVGEACDQCGDLVEWWDAETGRVESGLRPDVLRSIFPTGRAPSGVDV